MSARNNVLVNISGNYDASTPKRTAALWLDPEWCLYYAQQLRAYLKPGSTISLFVSDTDKGPLYAWHFEMPEPCGYCGSVGGLTPGWDGNDRCVECGGL